MGIKGLFPYLQQAAPNAIKESGLQACAGRTVAIDASAWMYQFLTVVRTGAAAENLQNAQGQATSHLQGFLTRAIRLLEAGVRPVFVFDGKPPEMKAAVNRARREARADAAEEHAAAVESETATKEEVYKAASRSTIVTRQHNESVKALLRVMGLPVVEAPGEAEASCAQLCCENKVYASVTEDMDVLTFGTVRQLKNLFDVEGSRLGQGPRPAREVTLALVLEGLGCTMDRFIEFCILSGCDYLPHLPKVGSKTAWQLLEREGSLGAVVACLREGRGPKGCVVPDAWDWESAKGLFLTGPQGLADTGEDALRLRSPDFDSVRKLLIEENQFSSSRVESALERLRKASGAGGAVQQRRLDNFFRLAAPAVPAPAAERENGGVKRVGAESPSKSETQSRKRGRGVASAAAERAPARPPAPAPSAPEASPSVAAPAEAASAPEPPAAALAARSEEEEPGAGGPWACPRCTFENSDLLPQCEMCEMRRPRPSPSGAAGPCCDGGVLRPSPTSPRRDGPARFAGALRGPVAAAAAAGGPLVIDLIDLG